MPEPHLATRSALAAVALPGHYGRVGRSGATLSEVTGVALASIAVRGGQASALSAAIERAFVAPLPTRPARTAEGPVAFVWSGPEEWLAIGQRPDDLVSRLTACAGALASVTDLTGSRTLLRITGTRAREGLRKIVPVDLDPSVFSAGCAAATIAAHIPIQIWQTDDAPTFEIACPRSYAVSLWQALSAAFAEYGFDVEPGS